MALFFALKLAVRLWSSPMMSKVVERTEVGSESLIASSFILISISRWNCDFQGPSSGECRNHLKIVALMNFVALTVVFAIMTRWEKKEDRLVAMNFGTIKTDQEVTALVFYLLKYVLKTQKSRDSYDFKLNSFFGNQERLEAMERETEQRDEENPRLEKEDKERGFWANISKEYNRENATQDDNNTEDTRKYSIIQKILELSLKRFPRSVEIRLFLAHLLYEKMNKRWVAVHLLAEVKELKPSLRQRIAAEKFMLRIESKLKAYKSISIKKNKKGDDLDNELNTELLIYFQEKSSEFMNTLNLAVDVNYEFWEEVSLEYPESPRMMSLGAKIVALDEKLSRIFKQIEKFHFNSNKICLKYVSYIKNVTHDTNDKADVIEKAEEIMEGMERKLKELKIKSMKTMSLESLVKSTGQDNAGNIDFLTNKESINKNFCIIEVSGNQADLGEVTKASRSMWKLLGYKPSEVIGENISILMSSWFADLHQTIMKDYLRGERSHAYNKKWKVLALNKGGFLVKCDLDLRILSSLREGIRLVGILTPNYQADMIMKTVANMITNELTLPNSNTHLNKTQKNAIHYIQFNEQTGEILGVSESCSKDFGLSSKFLKNDIMRDSFGDSLKVDLLIPALKKSDNLETLESEKGLVCTIDTTSLSEIYLFDQNSNPKTPKNVSFNQPEDPSEDISEESEEQQEYSKFSSEESQGVVTVFAGLSKRGGISNRLRKASITACIYDEAVYDNQRVITINFVEQPETESSDLKTRYEKVVTSSTEDELNKTVRVSIF